MWHQHAARGVRVRVHAGYAHGDDRKWSDEEVEQFHKGITAVGRDFVKLQRVYLPDRALYEVVEFYYNVWKLKQLPVSRGWALREAEVRRDRVASLLPAVLRLRSRRHGQRIRRLHRMPRAAIARTVMMTRTTRL